MMESYAHLSREERLGLLVAGTAHVAIALALIFQAGAHDPVEAPQRITVSLAEDVSLDSTAPDPSPDPAAAMAPEVAAEVFEAPPPVQQPVARQTQQVRPQPPPEPTRRATPALRPTVSARATPTPSPRATQARPTPAPAATPARSTGSLVNENFMQGMSDATGDSGSPGDRPSAQQQASIAAAVNRQLKPEWHPPSGVDVDRLVTVVSFRLNRDGTLAGNPTVVRTTGQTASNRAQEARHRELALRAVRTAAPFDLPEQFYSVWRSLEVNFDNRLAQ